MVQPVLEGNLGLQNALPEIDSIWRACTLRSLARQNCTWSAQSCRDQSQHKAFQDVHIFWLNIWLVVLACLAHSRLRSVASWWILVWRWNLVKLPENPRGLCSVSLCKVSAAPTDRYWLSVIVPQGIHSGFRTIVEQKVLHLNNMAFHSTTLLKFKMRVGHSRIEVRKTCPVGCEEHPGSINYFVQRASATATATTITTTQSFWYPHI